MGAPVGNQNAAKAKQWTAAIQRALAKRSKVESALAIDDLAEKLLLACDKGEIGALKELGDRLEGKPAQALTIGGDSDAPLETKIEVVLVRASTDTTPA
jgi:hypothetical protein